LFRHQVGLGFFGTQSAFICCKEWKLVPFYGTYVMSILEGTADVLRLMSRLKRGVTMSDVVEHLGLPKSTASRMLKQLGEFGFLERDPRTLVYHPGLLLLEVAHQVRRNSSLADHVVEALEALRGETGHTGYLSVRDAREVLVLRVLPGMHALRVMTNPGSRSPAAATSTGRALLARLPDEEVVRLYADGVLDGTLTSPQTPVELLARLAEVRQRGWAVAIDEAVSGAASVSCAVGDPQSGEAQAFCLTFPAGMATPTEVERIAALLTQHAVRIGRTVGDSYWLNHQG